MVPGLLDMYYDAAFAVQCLRIRHQPPQFLKGCNSALSIGRKLKLGTQAASVRAICFFFLNCLRLPAFSPHPPPLKPTEREKIAKTVWFQVFVYPPLTFKRLNSRAEILKTVRGMFLVELA